MFGAITGDIAGSRFEWGNIKTKEFELLSDQCRFTDDTVMTLAVADAIIQSKKDLEKLKKKVVSCMRRYGKKYPDAGYGESFKQWLLSKKPQSYNSWGNGAAMRVSGCGFAADSIEEAIELARTVTEVTHNHPEGIKGAESVAVAIFMAKTGIPKTEINEYIVKNYYAIDFTLDSIREDYSFDVSCRGSVPQAFEAFSEADSFEDTLRNAISLGGDSDTIAAIAGSIAEAYYGIPESIRNQAFTYLDNKQKNIVIKFEKKYQAQLEGHL